MDLLSERQRAHGCSLKVRISCFISICGTVAAKAYLTGPTYISLGCPEVREHGNIWKDRLVAGLPVQQASRLGRLPRSVAVERTATPPPSGVPDVSVEGGA